MVFADVFGETQVVQLQRDRDATVVTVSIKLWSHDPSLWSYWLGGGLDQCFTGMYRDGDTETVDHLMMRLSDTLGVFFFVCSTFHKIKGIFLLLKKYYHHF